MLPCPLLCLVSRTAELLTCVGRPIPSPCRTRLCPVLISRTGWFGRRTRGRSAFCASEFASNGSVNAADLNDLPGLDFLEGQCKGRKVLPEVFKAIGG